MNLGVRLRAVAASLAAVVVLGSLAGCGDSKSGGAADAVALPDCLASLPAAALPSDGTFPKDWPWPPATVITHVEAKPGGGVVVTAQTGSDFERVLPFMQHDLEAAGFVARSGEAEKDDAEATWSAAGYSGFWAIRAQDSCEGTTLIQVSATKS